MSGRKTAPRSAHLRIFRGLRVSGGARAPVKSPIPSVKLWPPISLVTRIAFGVLFRPAAAIRFQSSIGRIAKARPSPLRSNHPAPPRRDRQPRTIRARDIRTRCPGCAQSRMPGSTLVSTWQRAFEGPLVGARSPDHPHIRAPDKPGGHHGDLQQLPLVGVSQVDVDEPARHQLARMRLDPGLILVREELAR